MFKNFCAKKRYRTLSASKSSVKLNESLNITRLNTIFEEDLALQKRQTKIEFQEEGSYMRGIVFTSDSRYFLVAGLKKIGIFETSSNDLNHEFTEIHKGAMQGIDIDGLDAHFITCAADSLAYFNFQDRKLLYTQSLPEKGELRCVKLSADGKLAAIGTQKSNIYLFNCFEKQIIFKFNQAHQDTVMAITFSKNLNYIFTGSSDKFVGMFDVNKLTKVDAWNFIHTNAILAIRSYADDKMLITGAADKIIAITDLTTREVVKRFEHAHNSTIFSIDLTRCEKYSISGDRAGDISICDLENYQHIFRFKSVHQKIIRGLCISHCGRYIVSGAVEGYVSKLDLGEAQEFCVKQKNYKDWVVCIVVPKQLNWAVIGSRDGTITIYDMSVQKQMRRLEDTHEGGVATLCISWDDKYLFSGGERGSLKMWDLESADLMFDFGAIHKDQIKTIIQTKTKDTLITASKDKFISIIDIEKRAVVHSFSPLDSPITVAALSNSGTYLAYGTLEPYYRVIELKTKQEKFNLDKTFNQWILTLMYTPDDAYLIAGGAAKYFLVHDASNPLVYYKINAHNDWVFTIALDQSGRFLYSGSTDRSVVVTDLKSRLPIHKYNQMHQDTIVTVALSKDRRYILTGSKDHTAAFLLNTLEIDDLMVSTYRFTNPKEEHLTFKKLLMLHITRLILAKEVQKVCEIFQAYPMLVMMPFGVNAFHFASFIEANNQAYIQQCIDSKISYLPSIQNYTGLHYLLQSATKDPARINAILKHSDVLFDPRMNTDGLLSTFTSIFLKLLEMDSIYVATFLNTCLCLPEKQILAAIPSFGKINTHTKKVFATYSTPIPSEEMLEPLNSQINETGNSQLKVSYFRIPLNFNQHSKQMLMLMKVLLANNCEDIFRTKALKLLIEYAWSNARSYTFMTTISYSIGMILFSVNVGLKQRVLPLEIVSFAFCACLAVIEMVRAWASPRIYIRELWDQINALALSSRMTGYILQWIGVDNSIVLWFFYFALWLGFVRWIAYLRFFRAMRRIVRMIVQIFYDLRSFFIVLMFSVVGFALMFSQHNEVDGFNVILFNTYATVFGEFEYTGLNTASTIFIFIATIVLTIVLINMIIAMMGESFSYVQQKREFFHNKEKVSMILESIVMRRFTKRIFCRKRVRQVDEEAPKYLFVVEEGESDDFEMTEEEILNKEVQLLSKQLKANFQTQHRMKVRCDELEKQLSHQVVSAEREREQILEMMEKQYNILSESIEKMNAKIDHLFGEAPNVLAHAQETTKEPYAFAVRNREYFEAK